jgi:hypothetical protein
VLRSIPKIPAHGDIARSVLNHKQPFYQEIGARLSGEGITGVPTEQARFEQMGFSSLFVAPAVLHEYLSKSSGIQNQKDAEEVFARYIKAYGSHWITTQPLEPEKEIQRIVASISEKRDRGDDAIADQLFLELLFMIRLFNPEPDSVAVFGRAESLAYFAKLMEEKEMVLSAKELRTAVDMLNVTPQEAKDFGLDPTEVNERKLNLILNYIEVLGRLKKLSHDGKKGLLNQCALQLGEDDTVMQAQLTTEGEIFLKKIGNEPDEKLTSILFRSQEPGFFFEEVNTLTATGDLQPNFLLRRLIGRCACLIADYLVRRQGDFDGVVAMKEEALGLVRIYLGKMQVFGVAKRFFVNSVPLNYWGRLFERGTKFPRFEICKPEPTIGSGFSVEEKRVFESKQWLLTIGGVTVAIHDLFKPADSSETLQMNLKVEKEKIAQRGIHTWKPYILEILAPDGSKINHRFRSVLPAK